MKSKLEKDVARFLNPRTRKLPEPFTLELASAILEALPKPKKRRRLKIKEKLEIMLRQNMFCWHCKGNEGDLLQGTLPEAFKHIAFHHINELEISGDDSLENIVAVHQHPCHDILTNGTGATTLNSSKHRIAKAKRLERLRLGTAPQKWKKKWPSRPMRRKDNEHPRRKTESS